MRLKHQLICHPKSQQTDIDLAAEIHLKEDKLSIDFFWQDEKKLIHFPQPSDSPVFKPELWKTTCFELFFSHKNQEKYFEFNFSPNQNWWVAEFKKYREIERERTDIVVDVSFSPEHNQLTANVRPAIPFDQFSLTAVIENTSGRISYWATKHDQGGPDFHNRNAFIELENA